MALRESPVRSRKAPRPPWLIPLLVAVGVLVVVGLIFGIRALTGGGSEPAAEDASTAPTPCVTETVPAGDLLPKPADVKVNVYNATATSGLASKTASALEKRGFVVADVANDPVGKPITGVGQIRYGPKAQQQAQLLLLYVPGAELVELDRKGRKVDLSTGDAFTGLAPEQQVNDGLALPTPVATGLGCPASTAAN